MQPRISAAVGIEARSERSGEERNGEERNGEERNGKERSGEERRARGGLIHRSCGTGAAAQGCATGLRHRSSSRGPGEGGQERKARRGRRGKGGKERAVRRGAAEVAGVMQVSVVWDPGQY